ncbi:MAG: autotransporter-associated beta strand repeat-containing protein [Bacteroidia bacterium]|nr:autotransporter-associated beta strand repeat-containing protein [Bacteroidia bacterium]
MPEYLYILDGLTGAPVDSIKYQPAMTGIPFSYWGANERPFYQWMSIAYLDGMLPSIVTERGIGDGQPLKIYGWDYRNGHLTMRPDSLVTTDVYNSTTKIYDATPKIGFGGHSIRIKDIDNDGKDEVLLTASAIDHDMKLIYNQKDKGLGHGDMFEVLDIDPDRPGMEFFLVQQSNSMQLGSALWDAATGEIIKEYFTTSVTDPGRAGAASLLPGLKGAQYYGGTPGVMDYKGNYINKQNFTPCATAYWDADLAKELVYNDYNHLNGNIQKYDAASGNVNIILNFKTEGCESRTMNGATMICDLLGDWREEILYETADQKELRIYSTTIPSNNRIYALMQNPGYRVQTTCLGRIGGFSVDYYLGPQMEMVPPSPITGEDIRWSGTSSIWDVNTTKSWHRNTTPALFQQGNKVLFDHYGITGAIANTTVNLTGALSPGDISVYSGIDYTFEGSGSLSGAMQLLKTGNGTLTINNANTFTGATTVWDGALMINNSYSSPVWMHGGTYGGITAKGIKGGRVGGSGTLNANLTIEEKGAVIPGNGMGSAGILSIHGNVVFSRSSYCGFDISETPGGIKDQLLITGNLIIKDTIGFYINLLNGTPASGDYPLIQCTGTFTGSPEAIKITGLDIIPCILYQSGNIIGLRVFSTRSASDIVWAGTSGTWDLGISQSWLNNSLADVFAINDRVTFSDAGITKPVVLLKTCLPAGGINITASKDYTFTGKGYIAGTAGLNKNGTGKLTIATSNTFTGAVSLNGGVTEINSINNKGLPGCFGASAEAINIDGGTLRVASAQVNTDRNFVIGASGATFDIADPRFQLSLNGQISGNGALIKNGAGALLLSASNTFSGGVTINEGDISLLGSTGNTSGVGSGTVTLNGGSLNMGDVRLSESAGWNMIVPDGKTARLFTDGRCSLTGTLTGNGTLNIMIPYVRTDFKGDWSAFTGTINILYDPHYTPDFRINNSFGYNQAAFSLTQVACMYKVGTGTTTVGEVSGVSGSELATKDESSRTSYWIIGTKNTDATFAGLISGPGSITKSGTGKWTLSGKIKHTGTTTVNGGVLMVTADSIKGSSSVTVNAGGTMAGTPFITGPVTVKSGGIISPGISSTQTGTIKLLSTLDLQAGSTTNIKINRSGNLQDTIRVSGAAILDGTLNITLLAGSYNAGNSFKIIRAGSYSGTFSGITPETPGSDLIWDMSTLSTNGTIRVKGTQTIIFNTLLTKAFGDPPFTLSATGGASGNPVTYTSSNTSVAIISGNSVTIVGTGTADITASQAGNSNYQAAPDVVQTLNVLVGITDNTYIYKVYPNPVSGTLYIETDGREGSYELNNCMGMKLRTGQITENVELDMNSLLPGIYNLHVIKGSEYSVWKILKL